MRIEYLKLKNFRQYRDEEIHFARPDESRNFTIIQGGNGSGKTNILNAITWCLYAEEMHLTKKYAGLPILNTIVLDEMEPGDISEVEVEIQMRDDDEKRLILKRCLRLRLANGGKLHEIRDPQSNSPDGSSFEILREIRKDIISVQDPSYVLQRLIPKSIEEYFFFDGERLNDYFREASGEKIKQAVFRISQLELFENVINHLDKRKGEFRRSGKSLGSRAKDIGEEIEILRKSLDNYKREHIEAKSQKDEAESKEMEYREKLKSCTVPNVRQLEEERAEIGRDLDHLDNLIDETEKDKFDFLHESALPILTYKPIATMREMISHREEAGDIPPDYKKDFLGKLIKQGVCICGTSLRENPECREQLAAILKECSDISDISTELIEANKSLRLMIEDIFRFHERQKELGKRAKELEDDRKRKSERLRKIEDTLGESDVDDVKFWESQVETFRRAKEDLIYDIGRKESDIEKTEGRISSLEKQWKKEIAKEKKHSRLSGIISFCDDCLEAARRIRNKIMDDLREEIERRTREQFFELIWKKDTYKDVRIDNEYNISVVHQSGLEGIGTLSAGERQVLALSFMAAVNAVSGFNVPIVIDTPLGRISKEPKKRIASKLPGYLKGKQVTMLVTEEEYTPEVRDGLSGRVGQEYLIDFKEGRLGSIAKVIPHGA